MRKSIFLSGIFMLLVSPWKVSGSSTGITIKAPENIVKYQLGTIRTKVIKKDLEEILEGLEGVVPVDSSEKLDRVDDFLSILLIYEDNEKDKFYFLKKGMNGIWKREMDNFTGMLILLQISFMWRIPELMEHLLQISVQVEFVL